MEEKINDLLDAKFKEEEFSDCFLVEMNFNSANKKLEVFLDSDDGITFEKCRKISRYLESFIDEEGWLGEKYILEVSSPGISRPLKLQRQYPRNIGRTLKVELLNEEKNRKGRLIAVDDEHITLLEEKTVKEGKKKRKEEIEVEIPFDQIRKAIVKVSF